eukprot:762591-Hanusia_phi.AAC.1
MPRALGLVVAMAVMAGGWSHAGPAGGSVPSFYEALPRHRNQDVPTRSPSLFPPPPSPNLLPMNSSERLRVSAAVAWVG